MNQELSTTEAKQVEQAANDYLVRCKHYGSTSATQKNHFEAGIEYALKELLPSRCVGFAEWVDKHYQQGIVNENMWRCIATNKFYTAKELYQKYITEYLKQQQDEN